MTTNATDDTISFDSSNQNTEIKVKSLLTSDWIFRSTILLFFKKSKKSLFMLFINFCVLIQKYFGASRILRVKKRCCNQNIKSKRALKNLKLWKYCMLQELYKMSKLNWVKY